MGSNIAILTDAYITAQLGGATVGAAQYAALVPDTTSKAAHIASADAIVVGAARKGGYSGVTTTSPTSSSNSAAFEILESMAFSVWWVRTNLLVRGITVPPVGEDPAALYAKAGDPARIDLPGMDRDALGGAAGADIVSGTDITTTAEPILTREALEGSGFG